MRTTGQPTKLPWHEVFNGQMILASGEEREFNGASLADQDNPKPSANLIYEDTGAMAPLVYFDIVGAYGTMRGAIEVATRILVPKPKTT